MQIYKFLSVVCLQQILQIYQINGQSGSDMKSLLTQIFVTDSYNKDVRPSSDLRTPITLDVDLTLVGINGLDELEQKLITTGYLWMSWTDAFLTWTPSTYNDLDYFFITQTKVWKPDITLQNGLKKISELGSGFIQVKVHDSGFVNWRPSEVFETKCSIAIEYFPFDKQTCEIIFVVWAAEQTDIKVTLWNNGITLENIEDDGMWTITNTSAREDIENLETRVVFSITFKRNSAYYVYNLILPIILLSILTVFTFVLPADSGEKMGYSITVFLSFAVFLTIVSAELPKSSGSVLFYYMIFELTLSTIIVCCTALQLRLHHRKDEVPQWVCRIVKFRFQCIKGKKTVQVANVEKNEFKENNQTENNIDWNEVVSRLDLLLFCTFLLSTTIGSMAFLIPLAMN